MRLEITVLAVTMAAVFGCIFMGVPWSVLPYLFFGGIGAVVLLMLRPRRRKRGGRYAKPSGDAKAEDRLFSLPDARVGQTVTLRGYLRPVEKAFESPLTGDEVVACDVEVDAFNELYGNSEPWKQIEKIRRAVDCMLITEHGAILVRHQGVEPHGPSELLYDHERTFAAGPRQGFRNTSAKRALRRSGVDIAPLQIVDVVGRLQQEPHPEGVTEGAYRDFPMRWVLAPTEDGTITVTATE